MNTSRILNILNRDEELYRLVLAAPNAEQRQKLLVKRLILPFNTKGKEQRLAEFFKEEIHQLIDFPPIPSIYFPALADDESIEYFQSTVEATTSETEAIYLAAFDKTKRENILAFSTREELRKIFVEEAAFTSLKDVHNATVDLFRFHLGNRNVSKSFAPIASLLDIGRASADSEIEQLSEALFQTLRRTAHGKTLENMINVNKIIHQLYETETGVATTTTNYWVPEANYWQWNFGEKLPVRLPTLTREGLTAARSIWASTRSSKNYCPWVELT